MKVQGKVIDVDVKGFLRIECPDAPSHLQMMFIRPSMIFDPSVPFGSGRGNVSIGDIVELTYIVEHMRSGLWRGKVIKERSSVINN